MRYSWALAMILAGCSVAQAGPFGLIGPRHRTRWANESVGWQQPAEWSYQASYQSCPCDCGQPAAVAPLQQGPVNAANPANAVQPMPANPPRLLGTAPGT